MAHFARVIDGVVEAVFVLTNSVITDEDGVEIEALGQQFLAELHNQPAETFIQCSYNGSFRNIYPGPGFVYDEARDAFIAPKPFASWIFDSSSLSWVAPVPKPDGPHRWDEEAGVWVEVEDEAV
jgi:hypothetical protein